MPYVYRRTEDIQRTPYVPYVFRDKPASAPDKKPDPKDYDPELCGTPRGYRQHHRYRQNACRACKTARNAQQRARLERKREEAADGGSGREGSAALGEDRRRLLGQPQD